jgi:hypothetical protein
VLEGDRVELSPARVAMWEKENGVTKFGPGGRAVLHRPHV